MSEPWFDAPGAALLYAVHLSCWLPGDLPAPESYPACSKDSEGWYAVVAVPCDDHVDLDAEIVDVRRWDWPVPSGVTDWRGGDAANQQESDA